MSNARRLKPREPDAVEAAFAGELRKGCPHCGSRRVVGRFRDGLWDYGLRCETSCRTFTEPQLAHRIASEAAERAAVVTGQRLRYEAFDGSCGQIEGAGAGPGRWLTHGRHAVMAAASADRSRRSQQAHRSGPSHAAPRWARPRRPGRTPA